MLLTPVMGVFYLQRHNYDIFPVRFQGLALNWNTVYYINDKLKW